MKKYISSGSRANSSYNFKWVKDEYLGGNMIVAYGQLANGDYFYANDSDDWVWVLNANPEELFSLEYADDWTEWLESHNAGKEISGDECYRFWIALFEYCKKNNISLDTYEDLDYAIQEYKKFLT